MPKDHCQREKILFTIRTAQMIQMELLHRQLSNWSMKIRVLQRATRKRTAVIPVLGQCDCRFNVMGLGGFIYFLRFSTLRSVYSS